MKTFLNKAASTAAGVGLFCIGCALAGLGLSFVALLALFGMASVSLAMLASPFIAMAAKSSAEDDRTEV